jgi:hypothetical protein
VPRQPIWTSRELAELKRLYESGMPCAGIAAILNRSVSAVRTRVGMEGLHRPNRFGKSDISALQDHATSIGLDPAILPTNPTAMRMLIHLAKADISTRPALATACQITAAGRDKAIQSLKALEVVCVDRFCSPNEITLSQKAYHSRPEPELAINDRWSLTELPTPSQLASALDAWLPAVCQSKTSVESYRAFIMRQYENAKWGDIAVRDFYLLVKNLKRK